MLATINGFRHLTAEGPTKAAYYQTSPPYSV